MKPIGKGYRRVSQSFLIAPLTRAEQGSSAPDVGVRQAGGGVS
jgi:hypothetical protein